MNSKSWAQVGLLAVLVVAVVAMFFRSSDQPQIDFNPYRALGTVAGEEVSEVLGGKGRIVLVIPEPGPDPDPVMESQLDAFKASLKARGKVEVASTVTVAMDPFQRMSTGGAMPSEQFAALRERHPNMAGQVFFIGFSALSETEWRDLKTDATQRMVVSAPLPGYDLLLREGILRFAIVPRTMAADAAPTSAKTTREIFDQEYLILRADAAP